MRLAIVTLIATHFPYRDLSPLHLPFIHPRTQVFSFTPDLSLSTSDAMEYRFMQSLDVDGTVNCLIFWHAGDTLISGGLLIPSFQSLSTSSHVTSDCR